MSIKLTLYSTEGCHLCEQARELVNGLPNPEAFALEVVDIAFDEYLYQQYRDSIPVLHKGEKHPDLFWPFTASEVAEFLHE